MKRYTNESSASNEQSQWTRRDRRHVDQTNTEANHRIHHNTEHDRVCEQGTRTPDERKMDGANMYSIGSENDKNTRIPTPRNVGVKSNGWVDTWRRRSPEPTRKVQQRFRGHQMRRWVHERWLNRISKMLRLGMWRRLHSASPCIFWLCGTHHGPKGIFGRLEGEGKIVQASTFDMIFFQENCPVTYINLQHIFTIPSILSKNTSGYIRLSNDCVCIILWNVCMCDYILDCNLQLSREQRVQCKQ